MQNSGKLSLGAYCSCCFFFLLMWSERSKANPSVAKWDTTYPLLAENENKQNNIGKKEGKTRISIVAQKE
jgi:hypothetical protein